MDLLGGIFTLLAAILVVVSILLGFVICNSINRKTRDAEKQREVTGNETQLARIESKLDKSNKFTWSSSVYMLGVTAMVAGIGFTTSSFTGAGLVAFRVGLVISIIGLGFLLYYGWFARR